jgi:hypothetical protein
MSKIKALEAPKIRFVTNVTALFAKIEELQTRLSTE